ncbi:MAG: hypothetical protein ACWA44_02695 [Thiotrichales bacterium]
MKLYDLDTTAAHSELIAYKEKGVYTEVPTAALMDWMASESIENNSPTFHDAQARMICITGSGHKARVFTYQQYFDQLDEGQADDLVYRYLESKKSLLAA